MWLGTGNPFGITGECKEGGSRVDVREASRDQVEGQWAVVRVVEEFWKREERHHQVRVWEDCSVPAVEEQWGRKGRLRRHLGLELAGCDTALGCVCERLEEGTA